MHDEPRRDPPDPGSRRGALAALIVSVLLVLGVVGFQGVGAELKGIEDAKAAAAALNPPSAVSPLLLGAKVAIGFDQLLAGQPNREMFGDQFLSSVEVYAETPADRVQLSVLRAEFAGPQAAVESLDSITIDDGAATAAALRADIESLRALYAWYAARTAPGAEERPETSPPPSAAPGGPPITEEQKNDLLTHHGWFARLALSFGEPDNPDRAAIEAGAARLAVGYILALVVIGTMLLTGFVLFIVGVVMAVRGRLRSGFRAPEAGGSVYLETFALFVIGFVAIQAIQMVVPVGEIVALTANWLLLLVLFWPLARGMTWGEHRRALGWHAGTRSRGVAGVAREIGAGIVGYLAGLPVLVLGLLATFFLVLVQGAIEAAGGVESAPASHPVIDMVQNASPLAIVLLMLLATAWAPVVEEAIFRGALYRHIRSRVGPVASGLLSAVVFAGMHPQGFAFIPVLASLGFVFALMREWRGSLVASMTAHAMHNAMVLTLVLFLASV